MKLQYKGHELEVDFTGTAIEVNDSILDFLYGTVGMDYLEAEELAESLTRNLV